MPKTPKSSPLALSKGQATRQKLIQITIKLLAREGFANTSFQMIADAAGLKQGALFYHFSDKDELIRASIESVVLSSREYADRTVTVTDDAMTRLRKYFSGYLTWISEEGASAQVFQLLFYMGANQPEFAALHSVIRTKAVDRLTGILHAGIRERIFSPQYPVDLCAEILHDALLGALVNAAASGVLLGKTSGSANVLRARARIEERWEALLPEITGYRKPAV